MPKCLMPGCDKEQEVRGNCKKHYDRLGYYVRRKQTTWKKLEKEGQSLPPINIYERAPRGSKTPPEVIEVANPVRIKRRPTPFVHALKWNIHNWDQIFTAYQFEQEFGIKFKGLGWYDSGDDGLLVLPTDDPHAYEVKVWQRGLLDVIAKFKLSASMPQHELEEA